MMRDDLMGGLLAFAVAAPVVGICCGGGGVLLAASLAGVGGWLGGFGSMLTLIAALAALLVWRDSRRNRGKRAEAGCESGLPSAAAEGREAAPARSAPDQ